MRQPVFYITIKLLLLLLFSIAGTVSFGQEIKEMFAKKEIQPDTSLTNHCEKWKAISTGKRNAAFGPFKIIEADFGKAKKLHKKNAGTIFHYHHITERTRPGSLTVLYNERDTAFINVTILITDETEDDKGLLKTNETLQTHSAKFTEMFIRTGKDTSVWKFIPSLISPDYGTGTKDYFGKMVKETDTVSIIYAKGFKGMEKTWNGYPTGLLFIKDSRQIAAMQYEKGFIVWLATLCEEEIKIMLGSFIAAYISAVQN